MKLPKLNQSGLLFVPSKWQRAKFVRWLKRIHAWTGFWGAVLFLIMGISGTLLNHRSQWKIETGEPVEVSAMNIAVAPGLIADQDALGKWAAKEFNLKGEARPPRKEGGEGKGGKGKGGGGKRGAEQKKAQPETERFMGKDRPKADKWELAFNAPNGRVTVEYVKGSTSVSVREEAQNIWGTIKNLHKGSGAGIAWILFIDTIGGALIAMSLTGFLLWSRLHGPRLLGGGLLIGSILAGTIAIWPYLL